VGGLDVPIILGVVVINALVGFIQHVWSLL
jgi:hypothetical protein